MHRGGRSFRQIQESAGQLLSQPQASEHDAFAAHLYRSRREYRSACERAGKSGKPIERCVIATFQVAESMGFKGDFRQWESFVAHPRLRIAARCRSSEGAIIAQDWRYPIKLGNFTNWFEEKAVKLNSLASSLRGSKAMYFRE